jgi:hypothetical protein
MTGHRQVDVVIVERMGDRAVDQRRRQYRQAGRMADDRGLLVAAGIGGLVEQHARQLVVGAGKPDPDIVQHALPGELGGKRVVGDRTGPLGQGAGEVRRAADGGAVHDFSPECAAGDAATSSRR